jgi:hypothetical protein
VLTYLLKLALTLPTSGGHLVGIVYLQTKTTEFVLFVFFMVSILSPSRFSAILIRNKA